MERWGAVARSNRNIFSGGPALTTPSTRAAAGNGA